MGIKGEICISYSLKIIKRFEQLTNSWSGGETTEIAIYPEDSAFNKRNFKWRISIATVDEAESIFTVIHGIWRKTMVIEGEMLLKHKGHHQILLKPFEQDSYSGEWQTQSKGRVKNFNLMMAEGGKGEISSLHLQKGNHHQRFIINSKKESVEAFYCINKIVTITLENSESIDLLEGDLMLLTMLDKKEQIDIILSNENEEIANVLRASIYF